MTNLHKPRRREADLSTQLVGEETLVYDQKHHRALCLNPVAAVIWHYCDGNHTIAQIATRAAVSEDTVTVALAQLEQDGLLQATHATFAVSRRQLLAAAALLPIVTVLTAPAAAQYNGCVNCSDVVPAKRAQQPAAVPNNSSPTLFKP